MKWAAWLGWFGALALPFVGCGPDAKPGPPCDGPTFNLELDAEDGPLPPGTRINVRYGGNNEGEAYTVGQSHTAQAVFCDELNQRGGAGNAGGADGALPGAEAGAGGQGPVPADSDVWVLSCRLYTQGPAHLDVTADGYESIEDLDLMLTEEKRCQVPVDVTLQREQDAGM